MEGVLGSIAFIPDGNRRFAKKTGISYSDAYKVGFERAEDALTSWGKDYRRLGIREVTFWALSTENLKRDKSELDVIFRHLRDYLDRFVDEDLASKYKVRIRFVGRLWLLPSDIQVKLDKVMDLTKHFEGYTANIALAYGGRAEIEDAVKALVARGQEPSIEGIQRNLYLRTEPDLVIRTGGALRMSGFMPWQTAYSEWYFSEKLWPEFDKEEFDKAVQDFFSRERRFGR